MAAASSPAGNETEIRAIVFKEADKYIGQCLEYDIAVQAVDLEGLMDRLELAVQAEFATCEIHEKQPRDCIAPAPQYYHGLWDSSLLQLKRVNVKAPIDGASITLAFAKAA